MPPRCILNGLITEPVPDELKGLDALSRQLIQRAKAFQMVVRLGTYMYSGNQPAYNSLQACKGMVVFLPLPLSNTLETLASVEEGGTVALPDPQLYVIVNGVPTKDKVMWQTLVDVKRIKAVIQKLRETNWLYQNVNDLSIDDVGRKVVEVVDNTSSCMLEKVTADDVATFQTYTILSLDQKVPNVMDTEQYRMHNVKETPLDTRQQHLDVACFPTLFSSGRFGECHPRSLGIFPSEYPKSRLLSKDSRFRKDPQYVFFLQWQHEIRQLSAGIYNLLKSTGSSAMPVSVFLSKVSKSNEDVEKSLSTILQSVRGSKQYWFLRSSELKCMLREFGPPTLFLTLGCAEYDSEHISRYVRNINDVPQSYSISRLCMEDPILVSRKFSRSVQHGTS